MEERTEPRLTWTMLVVGVLVLVAIGWIVWINIPRPVRADWGLVSAVDKFSYASWDSEITLAKDDNGRAELSVTETIVASFPDHNQNKGIVRGIPSGESGGVTDLEVTDSTGNNVPYERQYDSDHDVLYVLTGTDEYVHGEQTYVISYRVRGGVVGDREHKVEELYWNLLPLDSAQAIEEFSATVRVDPDLTGALTGDHACYQGRFGSTDRCELHVTTDGGAQVYSYQSGHRAPGDGVTVAVGFNEDTFRAVPTQDATAPPTVFDGLFATGTVGAVTAALGMAALWCGRLVHRRFTARVIAADPRPSTLPPMPQGGVPATLPPPVAMALLRADRSQRGKSPRDGKAIAGRAEMVHLAVQGAVRFEGAPSRGGLSVRLLDRELARHRIDQRMLDVLFPGGAEPDTVRKIPRKDGKFAGAVQKMTKLGRRAAARQGLLRLHSHPIAVVLVVLALLLSVVGLVMVSVAAGQQRAVPFIVTVVAIGAGVWFGREVIRPEPTLTEQGWAARDQLRSVRAHLRRELRRDRRAGQQIPGAEPVTDDGIATLRVYERLLPYAMLFGLASKWSQLLATRYEAQDAPMVWMTGRHAAFLAHWQYLNSTIRKSGTYTPPSTSSGGGGFSGGSSGGGFSGGGGGGGFSGGR